MMCLNVPFETNGKLMILGVPILKHFRVCNNFHYFYWEQCVYTAAKVHYMAHKVNVYLTCQSQPPHRFVAIPVLHFNPFYILALFCGA